MLVETTRLTEFEYYISPCKIFSCSSLLALDKFRQWVLSRVWAVVCGPGSCGFRTALNVWHWPQEYVMHSVQAVL